MRALALGLAALVVGAAPAAAQEGPVTGDRRAAWEAVHRLRAEEALASDLHEVLTGWGNLATARLTVADPALGTALYELGEARWLAGDIPGAREALDTCIRQTAERARCAELRGRIDLEVDAVRALPQHWTFDDADHGLFHPRAFWDRGTIRLDRQDNDGVLVWSTRVDARGPDQLVAGFDRPSPAPAVLRLDVTSTVLDAALEIVVEDDLGGVAVLTRPPARLPAGRRIQLTVPLRDGALDPTRLYRLTLRDATAQAGSLGANTLVLHDLVIE